MVLCFAASCNHQTVRDKCSFFRFPSGKIERALWILFSKRQDREPKVDERLCSCHFKDGVKENGLLNFGSSVETLFDFPFPEKKNKMGRKCCVRGCRSNHNTEKSYTSCFRFPSSKKRRAIWIHNMNFRPDFKPSDTAVVCIKHFEDRFVIREDKMARDDGSMLVIPRKKLALTSDAVPSIFPVQRKRNRRPKKRNDPSENESEIDDQEQTNDDKVEFLHEARHSALKCIDLNKRVRMLVEILNHCLYFHEAENRGVETLVQVLLADLEQLLLKLHMHINDDTKRILEKLGNALKHSQIKENENTIPTEVTLD